MGGAGEIVKTRLRLVTSCGPNGPLRTDPDP
jgi:hypothetical protein